MSRARLFAVALMALSALHAADAAAARDSVVAVLYFDNNTGDREFDVLKKGFADMMITDLAEVEGLTVVEREKLQSLLDEIELQKSPYFDNKAAIKLGKGLGASHAVTGAIHAARPRLRIDVRMIDVASGKVVLTSKVTGKAKELFELEQKLVAQFVAKLKRQRRPVRRPRTRVPDVDTLVDYSRGVDLADKGRYRAAEKVMAKVVQRAPAFALARLKREEILRRIEAAKNRREDIQTDRAGALARRAERYLASHKLARSSRDEAKTYLAYRALRGRFLAAEMIAHLGGTKTIRVVKRGKRRKAVAAMKAYAANYRRLIREFDQYAGAHARKYADGTTSLDSDFELPDEDEQRARDAGLAHDVRRDLNDPEHRLAEFLLLGEFRDAAGTRYIAAPTLSDLEPEFAGTGYKLLNRAWARADRAAAKNPRHQHRAIQILQTHAEALLLRDKSDAAIAKLQKILDRYPTNKQFKRVEKQIKVQLGLAHDHAVKKRERYAQGLQRCKFMDLVVGWSGILSHRKRTLGMKAAAVTVAEIEKHCLGAAKLRKSYWARLYRDAGLFAARHDDCKMFEDYVTLALQRGASPREMDAYRRNYSRCPAP